MITIGRTHEIKNPFININYAKNRYLIIELYLKRNWGYFFRLSNDNMSITGISKLSITTARIGN